MSDTKTNTPNNVSSLKLMSSKTRQRRTSVSNIISSAVKSVVTNPLNALVGKEPVAGKFNARQRAMERADIASGRKKRRVRKYTYESFDDRVRGEKREKALNKQELDAERKSFTEEKSWKLAHENVLLELLRNSNRKSDKDALAELEAKKAVEKSKKKDDKKKPEKEWSDYLSANGFFAKYLSEREFIDIPFDDDDDLGDNGYPYLFGYNHINHSVSPTDALEAYKNSRHFIKLNPNKFSESRSEDERHLFKDVFFDSDVYVCLKPLPVLYHHAKTIALSDYSPRGTGKMDIVLSIDTEFQRVQDQSKNEALSYQVTCAGYNGSLFQLMIVPKNGFRVSSAGLADFCSFLVDGTYKAVNQSVLMIGHYFSAEWSLFADRVELSKYMMDIRKCSVTRDGGGYFFKSRRSTGNYRNFRVVIADSFLASPAKFASLKSWGGAFLYPKITLPDGAIENMKGLWNNNPCLFTQYAMRDTEIPLMVLSNYYNICRDMSFRAGKTLGASSVNYFEQIAGSRNDLAVRYAGLKKVEKSYDVSDARQMGDVLAAHSFHGGFNNVNYHGEIETEGTNRLLDCDLKSAYLLVMSQLPFLDFTKRPIILTSDGEAGQKDIINKMKYHHVEKKCPVTVLCHFTSNEGTAFYENPCLPVRSDNGLQFVRSGESFCTAPEVLLALEMGANVVIERVEIWQRDKDARYSAYERMVMLLAEEHGMKVCFSKVESARTKLEDCEKYLKDRDVKIPKIGMYSSVLSTLVQKRFAYEKQAKHDDTPLSQKVISSIYAAYMKELGNSLYGKVAQAVIDRTITSFSPFVDNEAKMLTPSKVTLPIAATMITGMIRACVHSMNWEFRKHGYEVLSSTTDGSLVMGPDISNEEMHELLKDSYASKTLREGQKYLGTEGENIYEIKHQGNRAIIRRTRAYTLYEDNTPVMIAKGGIKIEGDDVAVAQRLEELDDEKFVVMYHEKRLVNARDIAWFRVADLVSVDVQKRTHNDFDFKRNLLANGYTTAWNNIDEYRYTRNLADLCHQAGARASFTNIEMRRNGLMVNRSFEKSFMHVVRGFCAFGYHGWQFNNGSQAKMFDISKSNESQIRGRYIKKLKLSQLAGNMDDEAVSKMVYELLDKLPRTDVVVNELNILITSMVIDGNPVSDTLRQEMIGAITYDVGQTDVGNWAEYELPPLMGKWILSTDEDGKLIRKRRTERRMINPKIGQENGHIAARKSIYLRQQYEQDVKNTKEWNKHKSGVVKVKTSHIREAYQAACKFLGIKYCGDVIQRVKNKRVKKEFDRYVSDFLKEKFSVCFESIRCDKVPA